VVGGSVFQMGRLTVMMGSPTQGFEARESVGEQ
jgi:hypothetical protein